MGTRMHNNGAHPKVKAIIESLKGIGAEPRTMNGAACKKGHKLKIAQGARRATLPFATSGCWVDATKKDAP